MAELDDILPEHEPAQRDCVVLAVAVGSAWPRRPLKARERKLLKKLADDIAARKLIEHVRSMPQDDWKWALHRWPSAHLRKRERGRPKI